MHTEKRQDQLQKNSGDDRVQGGNPDLRENNPAEGVAEADRAFGQSCGKRPHMADWLTFVQRNKGKDYHPNRRCTTECIASLPVCCSSLECSSSQTVASDFKSSTLPGNPG